MSKRFTSWLRDLFRPSRPLRQRARASAFVPRLEPLEDRCVPSTASAHVPRLEPLEDRCVPSTFTVVNTDDNVSPGSQRLAVGQADGPREAGAHARCHGALRTGQQFIEHDPQRKDSTTGTDTIEIDSGVVSTPQTITLTDGLILSYTSGTTTITGTDTIEFDSGVFSTPQTITLTDGLILSDTSGTTTITGTDTIEIDSGVVSTPQTITLTDGLILSDTSGTTTITGTDTIEFDSGVFSTPQTITLTDGLILSYPRYIMIDTSETTTITGPAADPLTVSGNTPFGVLFSIPDVIDIADVIAFLRG